MNCNECIRANDIPYCYSGTVNVTIGYLDASYQNTDVLVRLTHIPTNRVVTEDVTADASGFVTFTAFNFMGGVYKIEVLDKDDFNVLTIYSDEATTTVSGCCVEFETFNDERTTDFSLNFETC